MLVSVPKHKKVVMCLMEKTCVLENSVQWVSYSWGMSYSTHSALGCEFSVNGSTPYSKKSLNRNTHKTRLRIDWLMRILWVACQRNPVFLLELMIQNSLIQYLWPLCWTLTTANHRIDGVYILPTLKRNFCDSLYVASPLPYKLDLRFTEEGWNHFK